LTRRPPLFNAFQNLLKTLEGRVYFYLLENLLKKLKVGMIQIHLC